MVQQRNLAMSVQSPTVPKTIQMAKAMERKHRTLWEDAWVQFRRNKLAMLGLTVLALLVIGILAGPLIYQASPEHIDITQSSVRPNAAHPLGTDDLGRDVLARNLYGGRISLAVGVVAMVLAIAFGTLIGALSGYFPALDNPLMRFT